MMLSAPGAVVVFFFFVARGLRSVDVGRFDLSSRAGELRLRGGEADDDGSRVCSLISSDSATNRSSIGWLLGPTPEFWVRLASISSFVLGNCLAAAAHDRSVVRDARKAASWSSRAVGDMKLGVSRTLVWDRWENEGRVKPLWG
jgi:hypothetical protein